MSVEPAVTDAPLTMTGLFVRLLGCLLVGVPAGFVAYRWLHRAFEGHASAQDTLVALVAVGVLALVMRFAARSLARAP
jgi:hypothetical protein